jgi:hypothetical protein
VIGATPGSKDAMAPSAFEDKSHRPEADELARMLGRSAALWAPVIAETSERHGPIAQEWSFAGAKFGWSLRLKQKTRVVLYLTPQAGVFQLGIVVGAKAAARAVVPARVRALLDEAPRYAEGIGIRFPVRTKQDVAAARHLADTKLST